MLYVSFSINTLAILVTLVFILIYLHYLSTMTLNVYSMHLWHAIMQYKALRNNFIIKENLLQKENNSESKKSWRPFFIFSKKHLLRINQRRKLAQLESYVNTAIIFYSPNGMKLFCIPLQYIYIYIGRLWPLL